MKNIPKILLGFYLRRNPNRFRLTQFNFLYRYAWLQSLLEELRPELFPAKEEAAAEEVVAEVEPPSDEVLQLLDESVRGRKGTYHVEQWLGARGMGHLFTATQVSSKAAVIVKEYLLPSRLFNDEEAQQRQKNFVNLAGLNLADGREQDFRLIAPIEAIADEQSVNRCYLVTDSRDRSPTLRQYLAESGPVPPEQVRIWLNQILQSLEFLHQQKYMLPSGRVQLGLVHGNLDLDTLLWVNHGGQPFLYLCDLALWERLFDPPTVEHLPKTVAQDLEAVGLIGLQLLTGNPPALDPREDEFWPRKDVFLEDFLRRLLAFGPPFETAELARQELLLLPQPSLPPPLAKASEAELEAEKRRRSRWWLWLIGLSAIAALGTIAWVFWPRSPVLSDEEDPSLCCLNEVSAVPEGIFVYTAVQDGTWSGIVQQNQQSQPRQSTLNLELAESYPNLRLVYRPAESIEAAIAAVENRQVNFAVVPLVQDLPIGLGAQKIAYDGLAVFVAFSYAERNQSLPRTLEGDLTLEQVQQIYLGQLYSWQEIGGADLPIRLYVPQNPEALDLFARKILKLGWMNAPRDKITQLPTLEMLRTIIQDFEGGAVGSVGFSPLSQIFGQCSVYPLALAADGSAVQPLVLRNGETVTPRTDLCDRKGNYYPDLEAFRSGEYPLAYPVAVIYLQDNSIPPIGEKFAEMLRTEEGQRFLAEAGLVPLVEPTELLQ
ncbi:MAG: phosphate ABC transporter substrate-binding protein [Leptolyngbya sp. SIO4C5]|nr:phosphate ABC transporter substrate-binding protein [Leptolyngbya sp. SIO4C5]